MQGESKPAYHYLHTIPANRSWSPRIEIANLYWSPAHVYSAQRNRSHTDPRPLSGRGLLRRNPPPTPTSLAYSGKVIETHHPMRSIRFGDRLRRQLSLELARPLRSSPGRSCLPHASSQTSRPPPNRQLARPPGSPLPWPRGRSPLVRISLATSPRHLQQDASSRRRHLQHPLHPPARGCRLRSSP